MNIDPGSLIFPQMHVAELCSTKLCRFDFRQVF